MSRVIVTREKLVAVANAIRTKSDTVKALTLDEMPQAIDGIQGGGSGTDDSLNAYFGKTLEDVDCDAAISINPYAFYQNGGIKKVRFANATTVGNNNFQTCENLESVDLPMVTGDCGTNFCNGCKSLVSVNIPSVTELGNYAFQSCSVIKKIDLPSVQSIGNYCLRYTSKLEALILRYEGGVVAKGSGILNGSNIVSSSGTGYIYVPKSLLETYKASSNWASFESRFRAIEDYPEITGG